MKRDLVLAGGIGGALLDGAAFFVVFGRPTPAFWNDGMSVLPMATASVGGTVGVAPGVIVGLFLRKS